MSSANPAAATDSPYWAALAEGRLAMQCCAGCGDWKWPAVTRCGTCGAFDPPWRDIAFEARVFSWTRVWYAFGGTEGLSPPYITILAALPQAGDRRLLGLYDGDPAALAFDLPLVGRVGATRFGSADIPAIRWALA